jgi:hypothetical protein
MYRTSISMFSDTRIGPSSDMLFNKTLEARKFMKFMEEEIGFIILYTVRGVKLSSF